MQLLILIAR